VNQFVPAVRTGTPASLAAWVLALSAGVVSVGECRNLREGAQGQVGLQGGHWTAGWKGAELCKCDV